MKEIVHEIGVLLRDIAHGILTACILAAAIPFLLIAFVVCLLIDTLAPRKEGVHARLNISTDSVRLPPGRERDAVSGAPRANAEQRTQSPV